MLQLDAAFGGIGVDPREPLANALVQFDILSRPGERLATQRNAGTLGFVQHPVHIGEDRVAVLFAGGFIALLPELAVAFADRRNKVVLLHVARRKRAVEIVDQRYGQFLCHNRSN